MARKIRVNTNLDFLICGFTLQEKFMYVHLLKVQERVSISPALKSIPFNTSKGKTYDISFYSFVYIYIIIYKQIFFL